MIEDNDIFYEVDIIDSRARVIGVKKVKSSELR
jgi:hypothetical protein